MPDRARGRRIHGARPEFPVEAGGDQVGDPFPEVAQLVRTIGLEWHHRDQGVVQVARGRAAYLPPNTKATAEIDKIPTANPPMNGHREGCSPGAEETAARWTPPAVSSKAHAKTRATGKPSMISTRISLDVHSGSSSMGATVLPTSTTPHPTTK